MISWQNYEVDLAATDLPAFDVVIIGAGLGGSITGRVLTERNLKVLFLEAGRPGSPRKRLTFFQKILKALGIGDRSDELSNAGRWARLEGLRRGSRIDRFYPTIGYGPGGSSAIYGAALERMKRADFSAKPVDEDGALPNDWPLDYDAFGSWYATAETMFNVCGTRDPLDGEDQSSLRAPPILSERDQYFLERFQEAGLNPYRLHVGIEYRPGCAECIGRTCPRACKADGTSQGLRPALTSGKAAIVFGASVETILSDGATASGVRVRLRDRLYDIPAKTVVLAAGALNTPKILLNSRSAFWPEGLGNSHDLVGRGLMFHISDFFALRPKKAISAIGPKKTLSFRDFYRFNGDSLGSVQSVGIAISAGQIANFVNEWLRLKLGLAIPGGPLVARVIGTLGMRMFRNASLFATIQEDFPITTNRVTPDPADADRFVITYRKSSDLGRRIKLFRKLIRDRLAGEGLAFLSGDENLNFGHACGSCRFGNDPRTSVLSSDNRIWKTENVYVVDSSFFPSSSGANPSLTVVANALRVGEIIAQRMKTQ